MSEMPWVRFFPSDWLGGTRGMSAAETGIYITLIATMYERCEPVPEDHQRLARLCGSPYTRFVAALENLIAEGKILRTERGLWNERVQKENELRSEKRNTAQLAANTRWATKLNKNNESDDANALPTECDGNANQKPDTRTIKKKERLLVHSHPERDFFPDFWLAYPRRDGPNPKKPAREVFLRLVAKGVDPQRLIDAAMALAREHPAPTRFIPQAKTWLSQERFDADEPVITGDEFCPDEWPNTHFLKIRFRDERGHDPPPAIHGGRAGVFLPAEWVAASRQASNGTHTTSQGPGIRGKGEEVSGIEGRQEWGLSDLGTSDTPSAVVGLDRLLSMERHVGFGRSDAGWTAHEQDGSEPVPIRLRS
jgi:uncharacterized protein YdaU (DUF1376 family)